MRPLPFSPFLIACVLGLVDASPAQTKLAVDGLSAGAPLTIHAEATPAQLTVVLSLRPEWHVYCRDVGGGQPVTLSVAEDCAFRAAGPRQMPNGAGGKVHGKVEVKLPLQRTGDDHRLEATLEFMVCDPVMCLPPMAVTLSGDLGSTAAGFPVLLVVDEEDDRSARVAAFLKDRGFEVGVTTYAEADPEACEPFDVVLCDSKRFGATARDAGRAVLAFPKLAKPIVAVGFFGTELVEAHGVAMTSGYI